MTNDLAAQLFDEFYAQHIQYEHSTRSITMQRTNQKENQLILTVDHKSILLVEIILQNLGFKPVIHKRKPDISSERHFYSFDFRSDQFLHVILLEGNPTKTGAVDEELLCSQYNLETDTEIQHWPNRFLKRIIAKDERMIPRKGGAVIAFVGPDLAGKSTLVAETEIWLGKVFWVKKVHAGRPMPKASGALLRFLYTYKNKVEPKGLIHQNKTPAFSKASPQKGLEKVPVSLTHAIGALMIAWYRSRLINKAQRLAANGGIVLCDRYPSDGFCTIDSRRLEEMPTEKEFLLAVYNFLARFERQFYAQITPPDLVIRLGISLKTARKRDLERPKGAREEESKQELRFMQGLKWQFSGTKQVVDISTEQPLSETILCVKELVWDWI